MNGLRKVVSFFGLIAADLSALFLAFFAGYFIRSRIISRYDMFALTPVPLTEQIRSGFLFGAFVLIIVFAFERLYTRRFAFWEEARHILKGVTLAFILVVTMVFVSRTYTRFSRVVIILAWIITLLLLPVFRLAIKAVLSQTSFWRKDMLILGTGRAAQLVAQEIKNNIGLGYRIVGYLSEEGSNVGEILPNGIPVAGAISEVDTVAEKLKVRDFIIALSSRRQNELADMAKHIEAYAETIKVVPTLGSIFTIGVEIENMGDILALSLPRNLAKPWNIAAKRFFEFVLTLVLSILFFPLFLVIAAAIKLDSPGPITFTQERIGRGGRMFRLLKFRSMYRDADEKLQDILSQNQSLREEWEKFQKIKGNDPRVTRVGRFIRKWSLDELPQLLNVLRGDINLVGPRPYLPREKAMIGESFQIITAVKPGITGLWQIRGRSALTFQERLLLDEHYIRNWSLWQDIVILIKTIKALAKREGAF